MNNRYNELDNTLKTSIDVLIDCLASCQNETQNEEIFNEIIKDAYLNINNFTINSVELGETFYKTCVYLHDFNGTKDQIKDTFWGDIGCNGTVQFVFQSPIYLWLVTNM